MSGYAVTSRGWYISTSRTARYGGVPKSARQSRSVTNSRPARLTQGHSESHLHSVTASMVDRSAVGASGGAGDVGFAVATVKPIAVLRRTAVLSESCGVATP